MKKLIFCLLLLLFSANTFARNYVTPTSCYGVVYNSPDDAAAGLVSRNYIGGMGGAYIQSANVIAWGDNGQAVHVTYSWYADFQSPMTGNVCAGDVVPIPTCTAPQILNPAQSACVDPPDPCAGQPPVTKVYQMTAECTSTAPGSPTCAPETIQEACGAMQKSPSYDCMANAAGTACTASYGPPSSAAPDAPAAPANSNPQCPPGMVDIGILGMPNCATMLANPVVEPVSALAGASAADIIAAGGGTAAEIAAAAAAAAQNASAVAGYTKSEQIAAAAAAAARAAAAYANSEYTGLQGEINAAAAAATAAALAAGATAEQAAAAAAAARAAAAAKPDYQASPYDHEQGMPDNASMPASIIHALEYVSVSFFSVAGCPAPLTYTMMGHSYELTFDKMCEVMLMIRPMIIMAATATAAMIFIGAF